MELARAGQVITLDTRADAEASVDKNKRYKQILEILGDKEMTAKEIAVEMYNKGYTPSTERNFSQPRLNELMNKRIVEPIGKKKCKYTGRTVAVYKKVEE